MSDAFHYKIYSPGDAVHVRDLFLRVFRKKVSVEYIQNKYHTFYCPLSPVATIAFLENEPVAFYGALPVRINNGSETFFAAHACDSITLKQHRGKGLHYNLALLSYEEMKKQGIKFVFAMHSENTLKATGKLNWQKGEHLSRFHIKTGNLFSSLFIRRQKEKEEPELRNTFRNPLHHSGMYINYDAEYLRYKSFSGSRFIKLENSITWIRGHRDLWTGSINGISNENSEKVLEEIKHFASVHGYREVIFQVSKNTELHNLLSRHLTPEESFPLGYLSFDKAINPAELKLNFSDLDTF
ncbi:MAG: GNAT family N-acetyltransferase [Bacteroidota bacterium]